MYIVTEYGIEYNKLLGIFDTKELAEVFRNKILSREYFGTEDPMLTENDISLVTEKFEQHKIPDKVINGFIVHYNSNGYKHIQYDSNKGCNTIYTINTDNDIKNDKFYSAFDYLNSIYVCDWRENGLDEIEIYIYFERPKDIHTCEQFVARFSETAKEIAKAVITRNDLKRFE